MIQPRPILTRQQPLDLIGAYRAGQAIKMDRMQTSEMERQIDDRARKQELQGRLSQMSSSALNAPSGQQTSMIKQVMAQDPERGQQLVQSIEGVRRLQGGERKKAAEEAKQMMGYANWVLEPEDEQTRSQRWSGGQEFLSQQGIDVSDLGEYSEESARVMSELGAAMFSAGKDKYREKFGQPQSVTNREGDSSLVQFGNRGGQIPIEGYSPGQKQPLVNIEGDNNLSPEEEIDFEARKTTAVKGAEYNAKSFQKLVDDAGEKAESAATTISLIKAQQLINVNTGPGTEIVDMSKRVTSALASWAGMDDDSIGFLDSIDDVARFRSIQERLVSEKLSIQAGVMTDKDANRARNELANLSNPEEANQFISNLMLSESIRLRNKSAFYNEQAMGGNRNSFSVKSKWDDYINNTPLLGVNPVSGKTIFINQWIEDNQWKVDESGGRIRRPKEEILEGWRAKYGVR